MAKKKQNKKTVINGIQYQGALTVQQKHGNKTIRSLKIKNTGCNELFEYIANCLSVFSSKSTGFINGKPQYLRAFQVPDPKNFVKSEHLKSDYESLYNAITFSSISKDKVDSSEDTGFIVYYDFLITHTMFKTSQYGDYMDINCFAIYSTEYVNSYTKPCAYILITDESKVIKYVELSNYLVTWEMQISNKGE